VADFFDKLMQGVGKGGATVCVKSKEMLDVPKLKSQIADLRKPEKETLEERGKIARTIVLRGPGQTHPHCLCTCGAGDLRSHEVLLHSRGQRGEFVAGRSLVTLERDWPLSR
jgi:hypothetical protein